MDALFIIWVYCSLEIPNLNLIASAALNVNMKPLITKFPISCVNMARLVYMLEVKNDTYMWS